MNKIEVVSADQKYHSGEYGARFTRSWGVSGSETCADILANETGEEWHA